MVTIVLSYLLIAVSFSISSYFFIHIPALKYAGIKNDLVYSISYLVTSFFYFPKAVHCWFIDTETFTETLYSGSIPR